MTELMKPACRPQDCWEWLFPADVARYALLAFERARVGCVPPRGERFNDDGVMWTDRDAFVQNLAYLFELHIKSHAQEVGAGLYPEEVERLGRWQVDR